MAFIIALKMREENYSLETWTCLERDYIWSDLTFGENLQEF